MYLKRIEIKGFKSFADKLQIDIEKGITAVVGPNGSGKSNIADAIKWVLGEQSAKSLRGAKMEDVIFAGTEKRGALGYAEVTLIIDNTDSYINIDYSEISVKRRLYRTGESEYSLNGTHCRLKDILEIFMDTGIGKDGYSLIGQGKIDEILSGRVEDRRHLFEEAAGIVKYKWRKNESERKLENTRQNLLRVDDILDELEVQIEPLKDQSVNAKKYLSMKEELKKIEINLFAHNFSDLNNKLDEFKKEEKKLLETKKEYEEKKSLFQLQYEKLKNKLSYIENESSQHNSRAIELEKSFENKQGSLNLLNERHDNLIKEKTRVSDDIKEEENLIKNLEKDKIEFQEKKDIEKEKLLGIEENLSKIEKDFNTIQEKCIESENLIETKKSDAIQILKDLSEISNKINSCEINIKNLENRKEQILNEKEVKLSRKQSLNNEVDKCSEKINLVNEKIKIIKEEIEENKKNIISSEEVLKSLNKNRNNEYDVLKQKEAKVSTLSAMENDMEGFSRAVKSIMKKFSNRESVFGTINDIISVPKGYETSLEIALASSIQNIVVKSEDIAKEAIDYLKKGNLGRATFYPLTTIKGRDINLDNNIKALSGFKGIASDIVSFDNKFKNVITSLLGRVIICDNLLNAREIAKKTNYSFRIVTLEGDVINSGGSYTGGSINSKNSGFISRKNTIKSLNEEVKTHKDNLLSLEEKIKNVIESINEKKNLESEKTDNLQNILTQCSNEKAKLNSFKSSMDMINEDIKDLLTELEHIDYEIENNNKFSKEVLLSKENLNSKQKNLEEEIKNITLSFKDDSKIKEDIQNEITKAKVEYTEVKNIVNSLEEKLMAIENEISIHKRRINIFTNKLKDMENTIFETQEKTKIIISEIQGISKEVIEIKEKISNIEESKKQCLEKRDYIDKELLKVEETIISLSESIHKFDIQNSRLEIEIDNIKARLWEDYEITIPEAIKNITPITSITEENKKAKDIKTNIKSLGDINVNSIDEYKKVVERYNFLTNQKEDLINAEKSLSQVIDEITKKMQSQFIEKFKIMRENFNETFKELFGGGYADIKMEENDPLTSPIDIIVQPPGKKLQSLTLLSGGEKGLSAIALVFAILKMKPTPFCVLDEIEAALDDANVNRYAKFLKEYAKKTQFIIITHRKGSMAVADSLYGVTMEEKGISKVISLKLEGGI